MHDEMQPDNLNPGVEMPADQPVDHEGAMARADLYKLANYSVKLFRKIQDGDQLEGWVQAKITKAADYIASVYHYLEYEMKFSEYGQALENSDMLSESQKAALQEKLMEAKSKVKELKLLEAKKVVGKQISEGPIFGGHEQECAECGGTGMVQMPIREVPGHVKDKVEKYNRQAKAMHAASKRIDKNKNGIPDDEELGEETSSTGGEITRGKGFTRHTHNPARFSDEPHGEVASKVKGKSAAEKSGEKAADKAEEKEGKAWEKRFGKGSVTRVKDGKKVDEAKGDGNLANNAKPYDKVTKGDVIAGRLGKDEKGGKAKKVKEGNDGNLANNAKPYDKVTKGDVVAGRLGKDEMGGKKKKVKEAVAKAKAKMEGSIQGGVWVSSPDKGVPPPSNDDQGTLKPAAKKPAAKTPAKPVKKAESEPADSTTALAESKDLTAIKMLAGL